MNKFGDPSGVPLEYTWPSPGQSYARVLVRAVVTIIAVTFVFAVGGAIVGLLLGYFVPSYYRGVFHAADPQFSPCAVGFGLGLSEGAMLGTAVGVALVFIFAWRESHSQR